MKPKSLPIQKKEKKMGLLFFSVATGTLKHSFTKTSEVFWVNFHNKNQSKLQER